MIEHTDRLMRPDSRAKKILKRHLAEKEDGVVKVSATASSTVSLELAKARTKLAEATLLQ